MNTTKRTRYEIPALIVTDAVDQQDAWTRAKNLSATIAGEVGPGAFFCEIGVAPTNKPRATEDLEGRETVGSHVETIRSAVGDEWVWDDASAEPVELGIGATLTDHHRARAGELAETGWPVEHMSPTQIVIAHEGEGERNDRIARGGVSEVESVRDIPVCPECLSEDICQQTREDEPPWGCLNCDHRFENPYYADS